MSSSSSPSPNYSSSSSPSPNNSSSPSPSPTSSPNDSDEEPSKCDPNDEPGNDEPGSDEPGNDEPRNDKPGNFGIITNIMPPEVSMSGKMTMKFLKGTKQEYANVKREYDRNDEKTVHHCGKWVRKLW